MRRIALLTLFTSFALNGFAQNHAPIKSEYYPAKPAVSSPLTDRAASSLVSEMMPLVAPIVVNTPEVINTLVLANSISLPTTATILFYSASGSIIATQKVSFQPHEKKEFPLSSVQNPLAPNDKVASVTVEQDPSTMGVVVAGQMLITDLRASTPAYVDEELAMPEMTGSIQLSAVTDQAEGPPLVAVTNLSSTAQHVELTCIHDAARPVTSQIAIPPHATVRSQACSNAPTPTLDQYTSSMMQSQSQGVYSLQVEGDGLPGSLAAFAVAPHLRAHDLVFSSVPFSDPQLIHSSDMVFAGVPIGPQPTLPSGFYVPRLSYANFSGAPINLSVYLADTVAPTPNSSAGTSPAPSLTKLQSITVPAHTSGEFVFSGMEAQSGLLHSIVIKTDSSPGTYQTKLVSRSDGSLYETELIAKEGLDRNNSGIHPWSIDEDTESHLILFNHRKEPKKVGVTITSGASSWTIEFKLAPSETREISFNELEKERTKDDSGRTLPSSAKEGVVNWMSPESGDVTGRLMVTSRTHAMARNFSCGGVIVLCGLEFFTYDQLIAEGYTLNMYGGADQFCTAAEPLECNGTGGASGTANMYWTVGATNIITLNSSTEAEKASPLLLGVSGGTGTVNVQSSAGGCAIQSPPVHPTVQVPTALKVVQTTTNSVNTCPAGQQGWIRVVERGVLDQNSVAIVLANQTIGETVTVNAGQNGLFISSVATHPGITDVDGQYPDTFSFCSTACPGSATTTLTQTNNDTLPSGGNYPLTNSSIQWACSNIKINGALTP
jgi:hypothetical protein